MSELKYVKNLTTQEAQRVINALVDANNALVARVATLETNLGDLVVGDISGATDGQQLSYDTATETWIPEAA